MVTATDSISIRRPFDCLSKVIKVTVTNPQSHADLFIYLGRSASTSRAFSNAK